MTGAPFDCLTARGDELFELVDALLCADGPVTAPVDLTLVAEHRRGHGAMYDALNCGNVDVPRLRQVLAGLPQPQTADGRLVLAVDISHWLRPDAPTSADRLFCHVYGRSGRSSDQFVPGWPYSFVAVLETGRTSWCQLLDAVRLGPADDVAQVTAAQVRRVVEDLIAMGRWKAGDRDILIVFDAGYDAPRMAYLLEGLPVEVLGRMRTDRVMRKPVPVPWISPPQGGRPPKHGKEFRFGHSNTSGGCERHGRPARMVSMSPSAIRLARYTKTERDEVSGGAVDPSGVAETGLTWLDKEVHFGVRRQGRLVAHAGLVRVPLSVGAARLQVAGLGGVVVAPDLRGQGLARLVVTAAMEHARSLGIQFGLLFCWPDLIPLYERLGWRVLGDDLQVEQPDGPVTMPLQAMWTSLVEGAEFPGGQARLLSLPM